MKLDQVDVHSPAIPISHTPFKVIEVALDEPTMSMKIAQVKAPWRCYIRHADGRCDCEPPKVVDVSKMGALEDAFMYTLGAIKRRGDPRKLTDDDLILLSYASAKMLGHWGRLVLGQADLR